MDGALIMLNGDGVPASINAQGAHDWLSARDSQVSICKRDERRWLKYQHLGLYHSGDGGQTWHALPTQRTLWSRIAQAGSSWPPIPRAFGWRKECITVAHNDVHEDGAPRWRYISTFDEHCQQWSMKLMGRVTALNRSDSWWQDVGFEVVVAVPEFRIGNGF